MRALILTNEFPPEVYGGAGIHVDELTRHLRPLIELDVRTFGSRSEDGDRLARSRLRRRRTMPRSSTRGCGRCSKRSHATSRCSTDPVRADVVHAHTWYTHLAGILAQKAYGIPLA